MSLCKVDVEGQRRSEPYQEHHGIRREPVAPESAGIDGFREAGGKGPGPSGGEAGKQQERGASQHQDETEQHARKAGEQPGHLGGSPRFARVEVPKESPRHDERDQTRENQYERRREPGLRKPSAVT
jgi:hypothetical protein